MYFFLSSLSFTDTCLSSITVPKMLVYNQAQDQSITYADCLSQVCFVSFFGGIENCLLAMMAYYHSVVIHHPLRYTVIMNPYLCAMLFLVSLFIIIADALLHSLYGFVAVLLHRRKNPPLLL
jgi:olfactory receptor